MWGEVYTSWSFRDANGNPGTKQHRAFAVVIVAGFPAYDRRGPTILSQKEEANAKS